MDDASRLAASKFLSFVLRHQPEAIGITLDSAGWVEVAALLCACSEHGRPLSRGDLEEIVATSAKQRFAISDDGQRIRANQGHSTEVELGYEPAEPPALLFHGTIAAALPAIREQGISRMQRHHVHLSSDEASAKIVGARRGEPIVLRIDARAMRAAGHQFYRSANGVWLTAAVPPEFIAGLDRG